MAIKRRENFYEKQKKMSSNNYQSKPLFISIIIRTILFLSCISFVTLAHMTATGYAKNITSLRNNHSETYYIWESYLKNALIDQDYKFGIYSNGLLTVNHPEIYLNAAGQFIDLVDNKNMQAKTYKKGSVLTTLKFNISDINLAKYENITSSEFYPVECNVYPYLDRRVLSPMAVIRTVDEEGNVIDQSKIKQIEEGILLFLKEKKNTPGAILYLIYCDNEDTYLINNGNVFSLKENGYTQEIQGNPILIFNQNHVWYPLMGRDDTDKDADLAQIVSTYKTAVDKPILSSEEELLLTKLQNVTLLDTLDQEEVAVLAASKSSSFFGFSINYKDRNINAAWKKSFSGVSDSDIYSLINPHPAGGMDGIIAREIVERGNYLSPLTIYLASILTNSPDAVDFYNLANEYQKYFEWNIIWSLGLDIYSIDESYFCKAGACDVQAVNYSSIFDSLGIINYRFHGFLGSGSTHQVVYIPNYSYVASNHFLFQTNHIYNSSFPNGFFFINKMQDWSAFTSDTYYGNIPPGETIEFLDLLTQEHGDEILGLTPEGGMVVPIPLETLKTNMNKPSYQNNWVAIMPPTGERGFPSHTSKSLSWISLLLEE